MEGGRAERRMFTKVMAKQLDATNQLNTVRITFKKEGVIGKGSFGVVQLVRLHRVSAVEGEAEVVARHHTRLAMKTVVTKSRESRELGILKTLSHPNIVPLRFFFYTKSGGGL